MSNELSADEIRELEIDLHDLQRHLENLLAVTEAGAKPVLLKENAGRLSRVDEMHNQSILLANRNLTKNRIKQVIAALGRIKQDNYGHCTVCDEDIAFKRLKAYPEAAMCLACKSESEQLDTP